MWHFLVILGRQQLTREINFAYGTYLSYKFKKLASPLALYFNEHHVYALPFAHFFGGQDVETKFCKRIMHKGFAWNKKCILLGAKQPGCVVSVFRDPASVCVCLFLPLVENFQTLYLIVAHHMGTY